MKSGLTFIKLTDDLMISPSRFHVNKFLGKKKKKEKKPNWDDYLYKMSPNQLSSDVTKNISNEEQRKKLSKSSIKRVWQIHSRKRTIITFLINYF